MAYDQLKGGLSCNPSCKDRHPKPISTRPANFLLPHTAYTLEFENPLLPQRKVKSQNKEAPHAGFVTPPCLRSDRTTVSILAVDAVEHSVHCILYNQIRPDLYLVEDFVRML